MTDYTNLFLAPLPKSVRNDDLTKVFEGYGATSASVMMDVNSGRSKGFAFVAFNNSAEGERALKELTGKQFQAPNGEKYVLNLSVSNHKKKESVIESNLVYFRNIPLSADNEKIRSVLSQFGNISNLTTKQDNQGRFMLATVEYERIASAKQAVHEGHGKVLFPENSNFPVMCKFADNYATKQARRERRKDIPPPGAGGGGSSTGGHANSHSEKHSTYSSNSNTSGWSEFGRLVDPRRQSQEWQQGVQQQQQQQGNMGGMLGQQHPQYNMPPPPQQQQPPVDLSLPGFGPPINHLGPGSPLAAPTHPGFVEPPQTVMTTSTRNRLFGESLTKSRINPNGINYWGGAGGGGSDLSGSASRHSSQASRSSSQASNQANAGGYNGNNNNTNSMWNQQQGYYPEPPQQQWTQQQQYQAGDPTQQLMQGAYGGGQQGGGYPYSASSAAPGAPPPAGNPPISIDLTSSGVSAGPAMGASHNTLSFNASGRSGVDPLSPDQEGLGGPSGDNSRRASAGASAADSQGEVDVGSGSDAGSTTSSGKYRRNPYGATATVRVE